MTPELSRALQSELNDSGLRWEKILTASWAYRSEDLDLGKGFRIEIVETDQRAHIEFSPETFAGPLVQSMRTEVVAHLEPVSSIEAKLITNFGMTVRVNGSGASSLSSATSIESWSDLHLSLILSRYADHSEMQTALRDLLALLLVCLPTESDDQNFESDFEGEKRIGVNNYYERSKKNRAICIALKGVTCLVCGINFEDRYGDLGAGYIHVHHLQPVSKMTERAKVSPEEDLIPVCPNCHYMLHRTDPPLSPEILRGKLEI